MKDTSREESLVNMKMFIGLEDLHAELPGLTMLDFCPFGYLDDKVWSISHNHIQSTNMVKVKPGLHIVVTVTEHVCDHVLKRVLKLSSYRLQIFVVKYLFLQSLQLCEYRGICGKLKKRVRNQA